MNATIRKLIEDLDEASCQDGYEQGQGVCDQMSFKAARETSQRRAQAKQALIDYIEQNVRFMRPQSPTPPDIKRKRANYDPNAFANLAAAIMGKDTE